MKIRYTSSFGFAIPLKVRTFLSVILIGILINMPFDWAGDESLPYGPVWCYGFTGLIMVWREGIEFNMEKMLVRKYDSFLGIRIGRWLRVPESEYFSISHIMLYKARSAEPRFKSFSSDKFTLYAVDETEDQRCLIYFSDDYDACFALAQNLARNGKLPVYYQYGRYNELATEEPPFS